MDKRLEIIKTIEVRDGNKRWTIDLKPGKNNLPNYLALTEHKCKGNGKPERHKIVLAGGAPLKVAYAIIELWS